MWDLSAAHASAELTTQQAHGQRFVYVFDGRAEVATGSIRREIGREMCLEIAPTAARIVISSTGTASTMIGVFESLAR
jgi:Mg-chelatase subunit ChlD